MLQLLLSIALICGVSGQQASITVSGKGPGSCLTRSTKNWGVTKEVESSTADSVTFVIDTSNSGTETTTTLKFGGSLKIDNGAAGAATIGSIVFNLLRKATSGNTWNTVCTNIANTDLGDAATTANVVTAAVQATAACAIPSATPFAQGGGTQTYNSGSGVCKLSENTGGRACSAPIEFKTAAGNTVFSIDPEFVIPPQSSVELIYATSFVNPTAISGGSNFKLEIIVTFANAGNRGTGGASSSVPLDVGGNGVIDNVPSATEYPEKYVRSVPVRVDLTLPPVYECNKCVQLKDSPTADVTESGSLTFNTPTTDIANTGNEQLCANNPDGGNVERHMWVTGVAGAGIIGNCARLEGVSTQITWITGYDGAGLPITQSVPCCEGAAVSDCADHTFVGSGGPTGGPTGAVQACTYTQGGWFGSPEGLNPATFLATSFSSAFPSGVTIGTAAGFHATWTSAAAIEALSPGGAAGILTANLINPTSTTSGVFGKQLLTATLNVGFSDWAYTQPSSTLKDKIFEHPIEDIGGLLYCKTDDSVLVPPAVFQPTAAFYGLTVDAIIAIANNVIAGGTDTDPTHTVSNLVTVLNAFNNEFDNCLGPDDQVRDFYQVDSCSEVDHTLLP
jgi:hypothetical protein